MNLTQEEVEGLSYFSAACHVIEYIIIVSLIICLTIYFYRLLKGIRDSLYYQVMFKVLENLPDIDISDLSEYELRCYKIFRDNFDETYTYAQIAYLTDKYADNLKETKEAVEALHSRKLIKRVSNNGYKLRSNYDL